MSVQSTELLLANVEICGDLGRAAIRSGEEPLDVLNRTIHLIEGFIAGRTAMIVPPQMIAPEDLAAAIARGQELAEEYGW